MKALPLQRTSAAKAGWVIGLLFFALLAFLVVVVTRQPARDAKSVAARAPAPPLPPGLAKNPDWDGLPELFAVWSESAEWQDDRTQFAYWHPGRRAYEYYFEATRKDGRVRLRSLPADEAFAGREFTEDGYYHDVAGQPPRIQTPRPNFESESPTHPFIFFRKKKLPPAKDAILLPNPVVLEPTVAPSQVAIEPMPKANLNETQAPDDPKRK